MNGSSYLYRKTNNKEIPRILYELCITRDTMEKKQNWLFWKIFQRFPVKGYTQRKPLYRYVIFWNFKVSSKYKDVFSNIFINSCAFEKMTFVILPINQNNYLSFKTHYKRVDRPWSNELRRISSRNVERRYDVFF